MRALIDMGDYEVMYSYSRKTKDAVFKRVLEYFVECEQFTGEGIYQCDTAIINAHTAFADIADDIMKFEVEYDD